MKKVISLVLLMFVNVLVWAQPETPISEWQGKTILLIGAHPDDDSRAHGTLAKLRKNGNEVWVLLLTTGNVGTQDPSISRFDLSRIRRQEQIDALAVLGIPMDHYINFGYDDGLLEFADRKEVVGRLVRQIRRIRPDALFAFDPGHGSQRWHKADHRAAAYLSADAARAAMWRLLFEGQVIHEGLEAFQISEYFFFDSRAEDMNTFVDVTEQVDQKVEAALKYASQFSSGWSKYVGPIIPDAERAELTKRRLESIMRQNGRYVEGFRHYKGLPDSIGR
jgi:LmbE family N-acetylglucosaminyl deacetylase